MRLALVASAALAMALTACGGPPRTISLNYMQLDVSDQQAAEHKTALKALPGVHNVVLEHERNGTVRVQVYALDGREAEVMPKVEELGYTRVK